MREKRRKERKVEKRETKTTKKKEKKKGKKEENPISWPEGGEKGPLGLDGTFMYERFVERVQGHIPLGLPPLKGIEHHINLSLGATLPDKAAYKMNPKEGKEIQKQVGKLLEKDG
ncbi:hypothetical protein CR513_51843, partial [Mucuna pruriens]